MYLRFIPVAPYIGSSFFLCLRSFPLDECGTVCLFFRQLEDIWVSSLWGLRIKSLETLASKFLCEHKFSFFLGKYQGVRLLGHNLSVCLTL